MIAASHTVDARGVLELRDKYRAMHALRRAHEEAVARGMVERTPRAALRDLAHRFPGALAEIDRISPELLAERVSDVERLAADFAAERVPEWMTGWILAHRGLRGALSAKRFLAGRRTIDEHTRRAFVDALATLPHAQDAALYVERLQEIADPPRGRLVDVVFGDVARALGVAPEDVRPLLMPRPSRGPRV